MNFQDYKRNMCEKTKQEIENEDEKTPEIIKDRAEHDYYYDDAHGYELYIDENEAEVEND